jgi:OOP family OmpA-OmpF porin
VRGERHETRQGNRLVIQEQNRTIIREGGHTIIRHDDTDRFRHGARDVHVQHRGNETETIIIRPDGVRIITIVDADGRLLRRIRRDRDGREFVLIDNRHRGPGGGFGFIANLAAPRVHIPRYRYIVDADRADRELLYETLIAPPVMHIDRRYSLDEIRYTHNLREWMPRIDLDSITFESGSWEVTPDQARLLEPIAEAMRRAIERNPNEVYLIEGHTDAVGSDVDNLSLSDRRAEAVAEILTQDFGIPPENLTTQGYGEQYLKVPTQGPERLNRRVTVRRITPLLEGRN